MGILVFQHPILKAIILSQSGIHYMGITQGAKIDLAFIFLLFNRFVSIQIPFEHGFQGHPRSSKVKPQMKSLKMLGPGLKPAARLTWKVIHIHTLRTQWIRRRQSHRSRHRSHRSHRTSPAVAVCCDDGGRRSDRVSRVSRVSRGKRKRSKETRLKQRRRKKRLGSV
jgi:hypothetical protein